MRVPQCWTQRPLVCCGKGFSELAIAGYCRGRQGTINGRSLVLFFVYNLQCTGLEAIISIASLPDTTRQHKPWGVKTIWPQKSGSENVRAMPSAKFLLFVRAIALSSQS